MILSTLEENDRSIAVFTMFGHASVHWFELAIPLLLVVWLDVFEVSVALIGFIVALGYAPFGLGALPAGVLVDRYGPRRLILVCLAGMSVAFITLAFATSIYAIAVSLLFWGLLASIYHPAGLALISTGVDERGTVFAWHGIAGNLGIALGPFATATLLLVFDWRLVAVALALPGLLATLYGLRAEFDSTAALETDPTTASSAAHEADSPSGPSLLESSRTLFASSFVLVFAIVTCVGLYYRGVLTYLPELLNGLPALAAFEPPGELADLSLGDYLYVWVLVAGMGGQYVAGRLTDRIAVSRGVAIVFVALAVLAVAFLPVSGGGVWLLLLYCGVLGFALFGIEPFYQEAVAVYTPAETRGLSYGYTYLGMFGLGSASIAVGGVLLESISVQALFLLLAVYAIGGAGIAVRLVQRPVGPNTVTSVASTKPPEEGD